MANYYDKMNAAYKDNNATTTARNRLLAIGGQVPQYTDTYSGMMEGLYNRIKNGQDFSYNPENDAAYRSYADQYKALAGIAVAGNQAQAQDLTGGFGSSYAPEVARQGLARMVTGVDAAQPTFLQLAQQKYWDDRNDLYNQGNATLSRQQDELDAYNRLGDMWNSRYGLAANEYADTRDTSYSNYATKRDWYANMYNYNNEKEQSKQELTLQKYDTYNNLAGVKCADFNAKGDNKGMKKYLDGLVKKGKLTQYMADNLYKQYEYTPPKSSGGGGGGRGRRRSYSNSAPTSTTPKFDNKKGNDVTKAWVVAHNSENNRHVSYDWLMRSVDNDEKAGTLTPEEAAFLRRYIDAGNMEDSYTTVTRKGRTGGSSGLNQKTQQKR